MVGHCLFPLGGMMESDNPGARFLSSYVPSYP
jgi:hypothetical protein